MPSELDPAFYNYMPPRRRETPTEGMKRIELEMRDRPDLNPGRITTGAGRTMEGYNASIGAQGPFGGGVVVAADPATGQPVMVGGRAQAGPLSYQYNQPAFRGAPASQQVGVGGQPFDSDAYFGVTAQQSPGQGRTYGANVSQSGEDGGWSAYGGYNPTNRSANVGGSYSTNFASGGRAVVGHTTAAGEPVSLEEHKGQIRHRQDSGASRMAADYGYIDTSKPDHDGMKTDAFVGPHRDSKRVFVVNQQHPHTGKFNEHKVLLGYKDRAHALRDYAHSFSDGLGHKRIHSVVEMGTHELKDWLKKPHTEPLKKAVGGPVHMADGGDPPPRPLTIRRGVTPQGLAAEYTPPEEQAPIEGERAGSPSPESVTEGLQAVAEGLGSIYSTPQADESYTASPAAPTRRDLTPAMLAARMNPEAQGASSPSLEGMGKGMVGMLEDPIALLASMIPGLGNMIAAKDVAGLKKKIAEFRAAGNNEVADQLQKAVPYAAAGVGMPLAGPAVTRAVVKGAERGIIKGGERAAVEGIERGLAGDAERAAVEGAGETAKIADIKAKEKTYVTAQEGPYYRVSSASSPRGSEVAGGIRQEEGAATASDIGRGARDGNAPPQLPSYEDIADRIGNVEKNTVHQAANDHVGRTIVRPDMPPSSLEKQSAIGRTFGLAAEDNPAYKKAVFNAYKKQMPDIVAHSGATNYDELMAASYKQMMKETADQFDALPLEYSFHRNGEGNYGNSKEMLADLHGNGHLRVFQGGDRHDFMHNIDPRTGLNETEKFRAVHDAFGHGLFGNQFGAHGEELAWGTHGQMYSPLALPAMTAETRGQNSFVNYTPINAKLKEEVAKIDSKIATAKQYGWRDDIPGLEADRAKLYEAWEYAPNRAVLLPPEFLAHDYAGGMPDYIQKLIKPAKGTTMSSPLTHFSNEYGLTQLDPSKYGTGIAGDEAARLMKSTGEAQPGAVKDRSYFYLGDPSSVKPEEGLGQHIYTSSSKKLYDMNEDPLNLGVLAKQSNRSSHLSNFNPGAVNQGKAFNDLERLVKEYGYEGIANPKAAFPMAAVFSPKDVEWAGSTRQTVSKPVRYSYGDVYNNPRLLAQEAESRVAPEDPLLKQLFGVNRDDLYQIAKNRKGNMEPTIQTIEGAKVPPTVENIMTPRNRQRLLDALSEFEKQPGLRTGMIPWYVHDPVYQRLVELVGPEEANQRFKRLNVMTGMMSPGSPVETELNRGLAAHYLNEQGRIDDFYKFGGQGQGGKSPRGKDFPPDLATMLSHPYHSTSHAGPLRNYIEAGYPNIPGMESPKVPLYMQASGVPATGFQTKGAIPDAHWTRGMGLPDTRTSKGFNQSMNMREYQHVGPWFREQIAEQLGMEAVPAQALMWGGFSGATGVDTLIGAPKMELLARHIGQVAKRLGVSPEKARDLILMGKAYSHGGPVKGYAKGGPVTPESARQQVTDVTHDIASIAHRDKLDQRHLAYLLKVASGMYLPADRAMDYSRQIMTGDVDGLMQRFRNYRGSIVTFARLNQMMGGKHKFMGSDQMGKHMQRMKGLDSLQRTKEHVESAMGSDVVKSRPIMAKALKNISKRI